MSTKSHYRCLHIIAAAIFSCSVISSAQNFSSLQQDTSFTLFSAAQKVLKEYPQAKPADLKINSKIKVTKEVPYKTSGGRDLRIDIFEPRTNKAARRICILMIHGGGWRSGDKSMEHAMAAGLARSGFVCATVEYRLSTEARYPASIVDLKDAVRWLRLNAVKYKIDPDKIAAYGCSSGGHLACLLGFTSTPDINMRPSSMRPSDAVQAVIDIDGVLDLTDPAESAKDTLAEKPSPVRQWLGYTYKEKPELWREASPINHVTAACPPVLFINSSIPRFHAGRDSVISLIKKYNQYSEVHTLPNTPHPFWLFNPWSDEVKNVIVSFLKRVFG